MKQSAVKVYSLEVEGASFPLFSGHSSKALEPEIEAGENFISIYDSAMLESLAGVLGVPKRAVESQAGSANSSHSHGLALPCMLVYRAEEDLRDLLQGL